MKQIAQRVVEQALNTLIQQNEPARCQLAALHGRVVAIEFSAIKLRLCLMSDALGHLQLLQECPQADCVIAGGLLDLLRASDKDVGLGKLFAGEVTMVGDTSLGQQYSDILGGLSIDWEELLSHYTGDVLAHQIGQSVQSVQQFGTRAGQIAQTNLSEYLTEEARFLPTEQEMRQFLDAVSDLRDDVERLNARLEHLRASKVEI